MVGYSDKSNRGITVTLDPYKFYDYQEIRGNSLCPSCASKLNWMINPNNKDDRFCIASCCGMHYYMVPDSIRIVSIAEVEASKIDKEYVEKIEYQDCDEDFLRELRDLH